MRWQVRSNPTGSVGFVADRRRMNVAISRARSHVAVVCDSATIGQNPFLKRLLLHIRKYGLWKCAKDLFISEHDDELDRLKRVIQQLAS